MTKVLIEAGWVIPEAKREAVIRHGAMLIENDRIVSVGDTKTLRETVSPDRVIRAPDCALLPGFVNTHTHLVGGFNKGITEDVSGHGLFQRARPLQENFVTAENMYYPAFVHGMEMLMTGTTTINENWWNQDTSAKVVKDLGIRAVLAEMVRESDMVVNKPGSTERKWDRSLAEFGLEQAEALIKNWHGHDNGRITCRVGPHAPDMLTEWGFEKVLDLARKYDVGLHMHLAQIPGEAEFVKAAYGMSPVELMQKWGVLGPRTMGVHCVFMDERDVEILSDTKTAMSHTAYLVAKRGYFPPMEKIYGTGIQVTLGSDWCSNDMWMIMRAAILLARVQSGKHSILTGYDALRLATIEGAKSLGLDSDIGTLEKGKKADCILVNLANPSCQPIRDEDIITNLVFNANGSDVTHVFVDGRSLVEDRRLTRHDNDRVMGEAQRAASKVWTEAARLFD